MIRLLLICTLIITAAFFSWTPPTYTLTLTNPTALVRTDEPIVISRKLIESLTTKVPEGRVPRLKTAKGVVIPCQADDKDGDDQWEELAFLYSFNPNEKIQIMIEFVKPEEMPSFPLRAYAFLGISPERNNIYIPVRMEMLREEHKAEEYPNIYQLEGPCWENDKVGFRLYFDQRNSKDIFGKTSSEMVLERVKPKENYHTKQPWGMDILKVNTSLGAGALAILENGTANQTKMARLGENTGSTTFELVAKGPARAILRMVYKDWKVGTDTYSVTEEITIWGGSYGYQSVVTLTGFSGERTLLTGIANLYNSKSVQQKSNNYTILATHARQSENKDHLGMALLLKNSDLVKTGEAPKLGTGITQSSVAYLKAKPGVPITFHFYAGWAGTNPKFTNAASFLTMLQNQVDRLTQPIKVAK
jgi:hypothetical protein